MALKALSAYVLSTLRRAIRSESALAEVQSRLENSPLFPALGYVYAAADYTVDATNDNRKLLVATAAVNFTLPVTKLGLAFRFLQTADANLVITATSKLIQDNTLVGSTATFSTGSHKKGSHVSVECIDSDGAGTLKWIVTNLGGTTMVIA